MNMRPPSAAAMTDPGGLQARADGQHVEVRTYEGELIRKVSPAVAEELVRQGVADELQHCLRMKLGIRCLPPRFDRVGGRPDLDLMRRREPGRYTELWKGTRDAHTGRGALGRALIDSTLHTKERHR